MTVARRRDDGPEADEIERLFSDLWQVFPFSRGGRGYWPQVDCYSTEDPPELTVVVVPSRQGQGIGQLLLGGLIERAQAEAYRALSVSLETKEIGDYEAAGFETVADDGQAVTMRRLFS